MLNTHIKYYLFSLLIVCSCSSNDDDNKGSDDNIDPIFEYVDLPSRSGNVPETTDGIPHMQIDVEPVAEIHEELIRRVYSLPGIEDKASVVAPWRGIYISDEVLIHVPGAIIGDREFAHIHDDGSLHIFIEPVRASEAIDAGWAVLHPFAVQRLDGYDGFVMLYTPQNTDELDVIFQLIVDGYNYITSQALEATDFHN